MQFVFTPGTVNSTRGGMNDSNPSEEQDGGGAYSRALTITLAPPG